MYKLLPAILFVLLSIGTKAQTFTCPLMGWKATAPVGWQMEDNKLQHTASSYINAFKQDDLSGGMGSSDAPLKQRDLPPSEFELSSDPKMYKAVKIGKSEFNYVMIESFVIWRKDRKHIDKYRKVVEEAIISDAKKYETVYKDLGVRIAYDIDTQTIDSKTFQVFNIKHTTAWEPRLRTYLYLWDNGKELFKVTFVVDDIKYLAEMLQILEQTAKTIKNNEE